jgi:glycosyltransferase involved in cell wall biosynthesis
MTPQDPTRPELDPSLARSAEGHSLAVLSPWDREDNAVVSGLAYGLEQALEGYGVKVSHLPGSAPRPLLSILSRATRLRWRLRDGNSDGVWRSSKESILAHSALAGMALRRVGQVDGIVQLTSECSVDRPTAPLVTYEDMTIRQAVDLGYGKWYLAQHDVDWRIARQARTYRQTVACCTMSAWAAGSIRADYGVDPAKVKVVGAGANRVIPVSPDKSWAVPIFLLVAAVWERKNGPAVMKAFAEVRQRHPEARLLVAGRHPRLDMPGVETHGFLRLDVKEERAVLDRLFSEATCFVMPSLHEPLGMAYAEAGAAGIPSIGTINGGAPEVIGPGGTVVDPTDTAELVTEMFRFCDPATAASVGELARRHSRLYSWPRVAKRTLNALGLLDPQDDPEAEFLPGVS